MQTTRTKAWATLGTIALLALGSAACAYDDYGDHHRGRGDRHDRREDRRDDRHDRRDDRRDDRHDRRDEHRGDRRGY